MAGTAPMTLAGLTRGPMTATFNGATLFPRGDYKPKHAPGFGDVMTTSHGLIDKFRTGTVITHEIPLFGLWTSLSVLFPSVLLNPQTGTSLFPSADASITPLVINARNGDIITYHNTAIIGLTNLRLGVDQEIFSANLKLATIIRPGYLPTDTSAYFTRSTGTYSAPSLDKTLFLKKRWTGTWGSITGFGTFVPKEGFDISWALDVKEDKTDGYGVTDMYIGEKTLVASVKATAIGPTSSQVDTGSGFGTADVGSLLSANAADLTLVAGTHSLVFAQSAVIEHTGAFGIDPLRIGEITWETTRAITSGVATAVATIS